MAPAAKPAMTMSQFAESITDLGDTIPSVNIGLHGLPGSGKTAMLSALPDSLLLAFDPGWVTAQRLRRKCRIAKVKDYGTLMAGLDWLEDGGAEGYRWIIADGVSILQTRLLQEFNKDAWTENPAKRVSAYQPDKPDYFKSQNVLKSTVARLCDLPTNVALTFHTMVGDDTDGDSWFRPHIEGRGYQVGNFVLGLLNSIGYFSQVGVGSGKEAKQVRRLLWQPHRDEDKGIGYLAKDQLNAFPRWMDDPTAEQIDGLALVEPPAEAAPTVTRPRKSAAARR